MLNSLHPASGFLISGNAMIVIAVIAIGVLLLLAGYAARRSGRRGLISILGGGLLVLAGALITSGLVRLSDDGTLRRSVELRSADLTARAMAPGSALACLDAVANADVEAACEKALFATPAAVAIAVAYVDARISLLAASAPLAARDPGYQPSFERARRALEADPYGLGGACSQDAGLRGGGLRRAQAAAGRGAHCREHEGPDF